MYCVSISLQPAREEERGKEDEPDLSDLGVPRSSASQRRSPDLILRQWIFEKGRYQVIGSCQLVRSVDCRGKERGRDCQVRSSLSSARQEEAAGMTTYQRSQHRPSTPTSEQLRRACRPTGFLS
jgi:hypothetical protein